MGLNCDTKRIRRSKGAESARTRAGQVLVARPREQRVEDVAELMEQRLHLGRAEQNTCCTQMELWASIPQMVQITPHTWFRSQNTRHSFKVGCGRPVGRVGRSPLDTVGARLSSKTYPTLSVKCRELSAVERFE